jgi:hypothetical protein
VAYWGIWDIAPQVKDWLAAGTKLVTLMMSGDDESMEIREGAMCLSPIFDRTVSVEQTVKTEP